MPVTKDDGTVVLALVRGDDRLSETKLLDGARRGLRGPRPTRRSAPPSAPSGGSLGPVGFAGRGGRRRDAARGPVRRGREPRRLPPARRRGRPRLRAALRRPPRAAEGDRCPECGGALQFQTAIEVGHIFKLRRRATRRRSRRRSSTRTARRSRCSAGSYGIGPGRVMAAVVEQHHDEHGIAAGRVESRRTTSTSSRCPGAGGAGRRRRRRALDAAGRDVLLDDRDPRAGEKFADADLIGCPVRVTVGKKTLEDGAVDVRDRATGEERRVRDSPQCGERRLMARQAHASARSRSGRRSSG